MRHLANVEHIERLLLVGRAVGRDVVDDAHDTRVRLDHLDAVLLVDELHGFLLMEKTFSGLIQSNPKMSPLSREPVKFP